VPGQPGNHHCRILLVSQSCYFIYFSSESSTGEFDLFVAHRKWNQGDQIGWKFRLLSENVAHICWKLFSTIKVIY
jgi:hypothetical protein